MGKFTKDQIEIMRKAYGTLSRMNPSSPTYKKFIKFLDKLPKDQLKQLAGANIKFVSMLAKNRLGENLVNVLEATYGQMLAKKGKKVKVSFVNGKPVIKVVPINPEPIDEAPIATRAILKQLGSELNKASDMIIKITDKYKKKADVDGMVSIWMRGLHLRLKKSGVKI